MTRMKPLIFLLLTLVTALPVWTGAAIAQEFTLRVVEVDDDRNLTQIAELSLAEIKALPSAEFQTSTIWTEGKQSFRGVWLSELVEHLQIGGAELSFSALNEYWVEIPMPSIVHGGPLVAYEWNGIPMSPRDKGPLWVVFPYDADPKFQTETVYAQSIWQLDRIEVSR